MSRKPSEEAAKASESLISRALFAPVLFVSFIFSLLLIDGRISSAILKSHPEHDGASVSRRKSGTPESSGKFYRSNQRHLAKLELDDAFAYQKRVIAAMCVSSAIAVVGLAWAVTKAWGWESWGLSTGQGKV